MIRSKRFRASMVIAALALTTLLTSLLGMVLPRADPPEVAWVRHHVWPIVEKGVDNWMTAEGHVTNLASKSGHTNRITGTTNFTSNLDKGDSHAAVVARWHRDYLRNISRRCL